MDFWVIKCHLLVSPKAQPLVGQRLELGEPRLRRIKH